MRPSPEIVTSRELMRQLLKPLCRAFEAGNQNNRQSLLISVENIVRVLEVNGFYAEANEVDLSIR